MTCDRLSPSARCARISPSARRITRFLLSDSAISIARMRLPPLAIMDATWWKKRTRSPVPALNMDGNSVSRPGASRTGAISSSR